MKTRRTAGTKVSPSRRRHQIRKGRESLRKRLPAKVVRAIETRDNHRCTYCGATAEESGSHLHLDHVVPRSAGGSDTADNLVLACRACNCTRKAMTLAEWSRYVAATRNLHPNTIARRVRRRLAKSLPLAA